MAIGADSWFQADVAQLVEHSLGKGEVTSSILVIGSRDCEVRGWFWEGRGFSRAARSGLIAESCFQGGSNSVVESQPSKLLVAGSIPVSRSRLIHARSAWS